MTLSPEQVSALDNIARWLRQGSGVQPYFILGGYAGTGKTTLLSHFIDAMDQPPLCCAPTGKAASVLARKLKHIESIGAKIVATGNPGCLLQIINGAKAKNLALRIVHPITLLAEAYRRENGASDWS